MQSLLCLGASFWCHLYLDQKGAESGSGHKTRSYYPKEPAALNNEDTKGRTQTPYGKNTLVFN